MPEAVRGLRRVLAEEIRGRVTVVAGGDGVVRRLQPAVVLLAHDMTVGARSRIVGQIRRSLRVNECIDAQPDCHAYGKSQNQALQRTLFHAAAPCETRRVLMSGFEPDLKITTKQRIANSASNTNPGVKLPVACRTAPRTSGGKNPPSPPAAPTSPVTAPIACGKYSGTSLNTAPLPSPMAAAIPNAPMVNVTIIGQARKTAIAAVTGKTHSKIFRPPILSASIPPTGRIAVASTTNPAVRKPAAPGVSLNISVKKVGR